MLLDRIDFFAGNGVPQLDDPLRTAKDRVFQVRRNVSPENDVILFSDFKDALTCFNVSGNDVTRLASAAATA